MKGDFTRDTFRPAKHYQQVLMQQGRVQLDADWNEQAAIMVRRDETTVQDLVGRCGGPADTAAFGILTEPAVLAELPADPTTPVRQFALSAGRYYVHGHQCEVETPFLFSWQPDHRESAPLSEGDYLIYLDVWQRHVTMHEDPELRESALGGPDTGTRLQTVWQVRAAALDVPWDPDAPSGSACQQTASEFEQRKRAALPRLAARIAKPTPNTDPCTVPASAGYRGLENQLYRIEVHRGGGLNEGTFKWSRENGAVLTPIHDSQTVTVNGAEVTRLTVDSLGPDENLGFKAGDVVEVVHDAEEREGLPGTLAMIGSTDKATNRITLSKLDNEPMPVTIDPASHPRLRRWEGIGVLAVDAAVNEGFIALEQGVEVRVELPPEAEFRSGDYWQIPARTATPDAQSGRILWPATGDVAESLPPQGIPHHDCRLAILSIDGAGQATVRSDCRCLWPPLTAVPRLFYVSGDGQEVMPDLSQPAGSLVKLPQPLIVGVANGHCLAHTWRVRFEVINTAATPSDGQVVATGDPPTENSAIVTLDAAGLARAEFYLDDSHPSQQVIARLLDAADTAVSLPLVFNANLSIARRVAYQPGKCAGLAEQVTVQDAIDTLAAQVSLYQVSGDAQVAGGGQTLPQPLVVLVANRCGPARQLPVTFRVISGGGSIDVTGPVITGSNGQAQCRWTLGNTSGTQELEASLSSDVSHAAAPTTVRFTAQLSGSDAAQQPGMQIKGVFVSQRPLELGMRLSLDELREGLRVECDRDVDAKTVFDRPLERGEPTCFVTVEVPVNLTRDQSDVWGREGVVGYSPVVLAADVDVTANQIIWEPSQFALRGLRNVLNQMAELNLGDRILARLTLLGNFIWALERQQESQPLYLDGESFRASPGENEFGIQMPSGDGRRGGDFRTWFWLFPG